MGAKLKIVKTQAEEDFAKHFDAAQSSLPGSDKVANLRAEAFARFGTLGLPHRRVEEWKYTDLKSKLDQGVAPARGDHGVLSEAELGDALGVFAGLDCVRIVLVNGVFDRALSNDLSTDGVDISPIAEALAEGQECFLSNLDQVNAPEKEEAVIALNTAFMSDGALVNIEGVQEKPIHLVFVNAGDETKSVVTRNLINVSKGAEVTLLESFVELGGGPSLHNSVTELVAHDGTTVHHVKVQNEGSDSTHLSTWMVRLEAEATYKVMQFMIGAAVSRQQMFVRFNGENGSLNINGAALLKDKQHADLTMVVDHAVPHCESRETFKAVLDDRARGVFQAKVIVRPHAQKTDGAQMSQALLLSEKAEFNSKPELEIFADDVVCGHGATSGQIDEELLFYLRARGVPEDQARSILIQAFVGEVIEEVEHDGIRDGLNSMAQEWLSTRNG